MDTERMDKPVVAVDVGGTKILTCLMLPDGKITARNTTATPAGSSALKITQRVQDSIEEILEQNRLGPKGIQGIGIACAGGIDYAWGMIVTPSPNLPEWYDVPLRDIINEWFGVPVDVINDASAAALGEHRYGAGRGTRDMVLLTLGTGIGGGIVIDGRVYFGASGAAGEVGHMTVAADGPACNCGNTGCLEMMASGTAIARKAAERIKAGEKSGLSDEGDITVEKVAAAAARGDALANGVLEEAAYYLGVGLVSLVNIFNPEMIVLGGGMAELGEVFTGPARKMVAERAFGISAGAVRVVTAELGNDAGIYGAAAYVRDCLGEGTE